MDLLRRFPNRNNAFFRLYDLHINHVLDVIKKRKEGGKKKIQYHQCLFMCHYIPTHYLRKVSNVFITPNLRGGAALRAKLIMIIMKREKTEGGKKREGKSS